MQYAVCSVHTGYCSESDIECEEKLATYVGSHIRGASARRRAPPFEQGDLILEGNITLMLAGYKLAAMIVRGSVRRTSGPVRVLKSSDPNESCIYSNNCFPRKWLWSEAASYSRLQEADLIPPRTICTRQLVRWTMNMGSVKLH